MEYTLVPTAAKSGLIRPSAAGPLDDEPAMTSKLVKLAVATTFLPCLCPPVTFPHWDPAP